MSADDDPIRKAVSLRDSFPDLAKELRLPDSLTSAIAGHSHLIKTMGSALDLSKAFAGQEALAKRYAFAMREPLSSVLETLRGQGVVPNLAIGPLADLKALGLLGIHKDFLQNFGIDRNVLENFNARFRLPEAIEAAHLAAQFNTSAAAKAFEALTGSTNVFYAMERMKSPWLDIANPLASASAFATIQEMGNALSSLPSFDTDLASVLRHELGDWREPIDWPSAIFTDLEARSHFYADLGVNASLTAMPPAAFRESLTIAGLVDAPTPIVEEYEKPEAGETWDEEEEGFKRTNEAHNRLQRLEIQLRRFIHAVMSEAVGEDWPKHRMHPDTVNSWREKKKLAQRTTDINLPLIAYADFTDYERVICKGGNWKFFEKYFDRRDSVRESLQRLYPIRIDTMHSRLITQDDELFLLVECKRLKRAMERRNR